MNELIILFKIILQSSYANAINESGHVVGQAQNVSNEFHAFVWDIDNGMQDIGNLGGSTTISYGINESDQVVGYSTTGDGYDHAFIWDSQNGMRDLNDLVSDTAGFTLQYARAINNSGQIVGYGDYNGQTRAFLLTPTVVPEPISSTLFIVGGASLGLRRFWRKRRTV